MDDSLEPSDPLHWFRTRPVFQRRLIVVAGLAVIALAAWLGTHSTESFVLLKLPNGVVPESALASLQRQGLETVRLRNNGQLEVSSKESGAARSALTELASGSMSWADEWEKSNANLGHFSGSREREAAREIARARMISRLLTRMPGIAQADVVWDEEEATGWKSPQRTRCTVYLRPNRDYEITADVARSVRQAVAGSKKNLATEDIVVMDLDRMMTFDAVPSGIDDLTRIRAERELVDLRRQLEHAFLDCEGASVTVSLTWKERSATDEISLSPVSHRSGSGRPVTLGASNGFLKALEQSETETEPVRFEPQVQVTIAAPEEAAEKWVRRHTDERRSVSDIEDDEDQPVVQAGYTRPARGKTAETIRQSVGTMISRIDRRNLATGVAVHLTPRSNSPLRDAVASDTQDVDPMWFIGMALAGCLAGAWLLSSLFGSRVQDVTESVVPDLDAEAEMVPERIFRTATTTPSRNEPAEDETRREFETLSDCLPSQWRELWEMTHLDDWVSALQGASPALRRTILASLDADAAAELEEALHVAPSLRPADIRHGQQALLTAALMLDR